MRIGSGGSCSEILGSEALLAGGMRVLFLVLLAGSAALAQSSQGKDGLLVNRGSSRPDHTPGPTGQSKGRAASSGAGITLRVPQDHPTIQSGIDAASDGDTVLVAEGTYFENIRYRGKAIVLASWYLINGDTTHVENTVIDGSRPSDPDSGSVVYLIDGEDTTSVLCGFTIRGGTGTEWKQGYSRPRVGGGIFCLESGARVVRNIIARNRVIALTAAGGGLAAENRGSSFPFVILEDNTFSDNYVRGRSPDTWGFSGGADLWRVRIRVVGNVFERDTVVSARRAGGGGMFFGGAHESRHVRPPFVTPGPFPDGLLLQNIFRNNVVIAGSQGGVGGGLALDATATTTIADNVFQGNVASSVTGWGLGGGVAVRDQTADGHGRKFLLNNRFLQNRTFSDSASVDSSEGGGGALELYVTTATIRGNLFVSNHGRSRRWARGGAINSEYSSFLIDRNAFENNFSQILAVGGGASDGSVGGALAILSGAEGPPLGGEQIVANNQFSGNSTGWGGGAISVFADAFIPGAVVVIANNTIVGNSARQKENPQGGGIFVFSAGTALIMNNIL